MAQVLGSARRELERTNPSCMQLETVLLEEESLLLREAAIDLLRELGTSALQASHEIVPALEKLLVHEGWRDRLHGTSATRNSIKHTHGANDGSHHIMEYQGWRTLRVKAATTLAFLGEIDALVAIVKAEEGRPEVREAALLGLAELGTQGSVEEVRVFNEVGHLGQRLENALFDESEAVCMAAAHAFRALAPSGAVASAVGSLAGVLQEPQHVVLPEALGGMRRRRFHDIHGRRIFELDVVAALGCLGAAASGASPVLMARLTGRGETSDMRWAAAQALVQIGAGSELSEALKHDDEEVRRVAQTLLDSPNDKTRKKLHAS